jgi:hypothetical protein
MANVTAGYTWTSGETVTPAKLNSAAAPTVIVADNEVTTAKIADANVTTAKIADANVTTAKIADGNVTLAKLVTAVQQALLPAGAVQAFAMNSAPAGWLAANGNEYAKTGDYAALFAAISTTYGETNGSGGAGTSHFRVPDLRGYFVRGSGTNGDGTAAGTFGVKQADDFKAHTHSTGQGIVGVLGSAQFAGGPFGLQVTTGSTGGTETRPANIAMLYCIKF